MVGPKERRAVTCDNCFFNGGSPDFLRNKNKVLCYKDPPSLDEGDESIRHVYPVVHVSARCSGWRDGKTLETLDDVMETQG